MKRPDDLTPIVEAYGRGETLRDIAKSYGVASGTVMLWLDRAGVERRSRGRVRGSRNDSNRGVRDLDRCAEIVSRYREGETLQAIGDRFGITRERVRQILRQVKVACEEGGMRKRGRIRDYQAQLKRKARYLKRYAVTPEEYARLRRIGAVKAFQEQRGNASRRGIEWRFKLGEWWAVWRESGAWHLRGRGYGYVMARFGDTGPYAPDNVKIIHGVANIREYWERLRSESTSATEAA